MKMASKTKLNDCPFCGGIAERMKNVYHHTVNYVRCTKCGCATPVKGRMCDAVKLWNRRTTDGK